MNKRRAEEFLSALMHCQRQLDVALAVAWQIEEEKEREEMVKLLTNMIEDVSECAITPILITYPDLNPYQSS